MKYEFSIKTFPKADKWDIIYLVISGAILTGLTHDQSIAGLYDSLLQQFGLWIAANLVFQYPKNLVLIDTGGNL